MSERPPAVSLNALLLAAGETCWLAPATLVAEVIAHFDDAVPTLLPWREMRLPCLDDTAGHVRVLAVLRRVSGARRGFYALALREAPQPLQVDAGMLGGPAHADLELAGRRARVFDAAAVEARLPTD